MATLKFGNPSGTEFDVKCKSGSYINHFYGEYDKYIHVLGATCSDGKDLGKVGQSANTFGHSTTWKEIKAGEAPGGPYNTFTMGGDDHLIKFNKLAGSATVSQAATQTCPSGAAVGIGGTYDGTYINSLSLQCEAPSSYCYNHIEDPLCKDADKDSLNMACGTKWTKTCNTRAKDLNEPLVASYCKRNTNDPLCSCYIDAPNYIPAKLRQTPQCWNAACSAYGYVPHQAGDNACPSATIGSDSIAGVNPNIFTSNIKIIEGKTPTMVTSSGLSNNALFGFLFILMAIAACIYGYYWYYYVRKVKLSDEQLDEPTGDEPANEPTGGEQHNNK